MILQKIYNRRKMRKTDVQNTKLEQLSIMVDVPRFELGASSMPRKRASKLRHTPYALATY